MEETSGATAVHSDVQVPASPTRADAEGTRRSEATGKLLGKGTGHGKVRNSVAGGDWLMCASRRCRTRTKSSDECSRI